MDIRVNVVAGSVDIAQSTVNLVNATEKLTIPVLAYGGDTFLGDIRPGWEPVAEPVDGGSVEHCGHFIPEEKPDFVIDAALKFFEPLRK